MSKPRRKKGREVSGWIILDKPFGMGSTQAVAKVKWLFAAEKAGHAGTLDPLASGMLPIALGEATKTVSHVVDGGKTYRFTVRWGAETTTDDAEGPPVKSSDLRPSRVDIEDILPDFIGGIDQVPPQFSAVRIDGERAYDIARDGETVEIAARPVWIDDIRIMAHAGDETVFEADCGKGTYVRSLARDFGRRLGCFGHVSALRRLSVAPFSQAHMVTLDTLEAAADPDRENFSSLDAMLTPCEAALSHLPEIRLGGEQARKVRLGNPVMILGAGAILHADEAYATERGELIALGEVAHGEFRPRRVFRGLAG
ncbi:MAG: tRNA pseudouridine(55) synthase TruB [Rhizobiaceae bacterium]|nr:tRNA pseudouridine(55) synthase TruB [Rhizobiaceae bacterium]